VGKRESTNLDMKSVTVVICGSEGGLEVVSAQVRDMKIAMKRGRDAEGSTSDIKFGEISLADLIGKQPIGCLQVIDLFSERSGTNSSSTNIFRRFLQTRQDRDQHD
jgi:hypothetical protein